MLIIKMMMVMINKHGFIACDDYLAAEASLSANSDDITANMKLYEVQMEFISMERDASCNL